MSIRSLHVEKMKLPFRPTFSQTGSTIVGALVSLGIVGAVGLALVTIQQGSLKSAKDAQAISAAQELREQILNLVQDPKSWERTRTSAGANPNMACLNLEVAPGCATAFAGAPQRFSLLDAGGTVRFRPIVTGGTNQPGFTYGGVACNTFNDTAAGDASCVFGFRMDWKPVFCPPGCINPPVTLNAILVYRPLPSSAGPLNASKYSLVNFVRGAKALTKTFQVNHQTATSTGGGVCNPTAFRPWTVPTNGNDFNLVTIAGTTATLAVAGTYKCTGSALAFAVGEFKVELLKNGVTLTSASSIAPQWLQNSASFETVFTAAAGDGLRVRQTCETGAPAGTFGLGLPSSAGAGYLPTNVFASLICTLLN